MEQIFLLTKRLTYCKLDSLAEIYKKVDQIFDNELNDIEAIRKKLFSQFDEHKNRNQKCSLKSAQYLNEGDIKFHNNSFDDALDLYNSAVMYAPYPLGSNEESDGELCTAYKSRSKTFLEMGNYGNALYDIECAILLLSPNQVISRFELMLAKVYCLKQLNRIEEAIQLVSLMIEMIPCYTVDNQLIMDVINLKESLSMNQLKNEIQLSENVTNNIIDICNELEDWTYKCCLLSSITSKGRHYVATEPIDDKTIVMVEKSYAEVLFMNQLRTHCDNCFKNIGYRYWPCRYCSQVVFCSSQCAKQDYYHHYECGIIDIIDKIGPTHYLVFRIFLRIGTENALKLCPYIDSSINLDDVENGDESKELINYLKFMELMDHSEKHDIKLKAVAMVGSIQLAFILDYLNQFHYSVENESETHKKLTKSLILHFLKATINAFGIYETQLGNDGSEHIGNSICLKSSFFNHNCNPNLYWQFNGTHITLITNRQINSGEELSITYGPIQTMPVNERQNLLKTRYFFNCDCNCCVSNAKQMLIVRCFNSEILCSGEILCTRESEKTQCVKCLKTFEIAKTVQDIDGLKKQFDSIINEFQSYRNLTDSSNSYLQTAETYHREFSDVLDDKCELLIDIRTTIARIYSEIGHYFKAINFSKQVLRAIHDKQSVRYYREIIFLSKVFHSYLFREKESVIFDNDCEQFVDIISETIDKLSDCRDILRERLVKSNRESIETEAINKRLNVIETILSIKQKHRESVLKFKKLNTRLHNIKF